MKKQFLAIVAVIIVTLFTTTATAELYLGEMENNACAVFSVVNCINSFGLEQVELSDAIAVAPSFGWDPVRGMTSDGARNFAQEMVPEGIKAFRNQFSIITISERLDEGCTLLIGVDARSLRDGKTYKGDNHAIAVLGKEMSEGTISFVIVDPGVGMRTVTQEQLESCTADVFDGVYFRLGEC